MFLARQQGLAGRQVALKVTAGESHESDKLARLQHTNIVPVYSVHKQDEFHGLCMPYLGSVALDNVLVVLRDAGKTPENGKELVAVIQSLESDPNPAAWQSLNSLSYPNAVVAVISRLVDGLAFAHRQGIVHLDLKPANVLLASDGQPRLLDFNLSDDIVRDDVTRLFVGGTLPYMSAEQLTALKQGGSVGPTSDVFACGVLMYEMLTLRLPFPPRRGHFDDIVDRMIADRRGPTPSLREANPKVSPDLASIVEKCLHPDAEMRYASAQTLHEDLSLQLANFPLKHAPNRSLAERFHKWLRRRPRVASTGTVAMLAGLATLLIAAGFLARGQRLAIAQAKNDYTQFQEHYAMARAALSMPAADSSVLQEADGHDANRQRYSVAQGASRSTPGRPKREQRHVQPGRRDRPCPLPVATWGGTLDCVWRYP